MQWPSDKEKGYATVNRMAATTKTYADGALEVGKMLGVPVVNLWEAFMSKTGYDSAIWKSGDPLPGALEVTQNDALIELMYDGAFASCYKGYMLSGFTLAR